jgi:hypothetical protein
MFSPEELALYNCEKKSPFLTSINRRRSFEAKVNEL